MTSIFVERSTHPDSMSNTYLVADRAGGPSFFVDAGGPVEPLIAQADELGLQPDLVLLTHHHDHHVAALETLRERWPAIEVLAEPQERELMARKELLTGTVHAGRKLQIGTLTIVPLRTPGHSAGMLSFLVGRPGGSRSGSGPTPGGFSGRECVVFTGDTLFRGSVGGIIGPGHTTYLELRDSIMGTLMELPPQTIIYPGHTDPTTVAEEWEANPFIRIWRGLDPEGEGRCTALGREARLILMGGNHDVISQAWVRWKDGSDDIVPGSEVEAL